jgi:hypothetical protein
MLKQILIVTLVMFVAIHAITTWRAALRGSYAWNGRTENAGCLFILIRLALAVAATYWLYYWWTA